MPIDKYTHKLIQPTPQTGWLNELILCWRTNGAPAPDQIRHTTYSTNVNVVNCPECIRCWREGIYR